MAEKTKIDREQGLQGSGLRSLGGRIRNARKTVGLSTEAVAIYCGVTDSAIRQWEGGFQPITLGHLVSVGECVEQSLDWLVLGGGEMDSIDAKVRRIPEIYRDAVIMEINKIITKRQKEAQKELPPELLKGHMIKDVDERLKAWTAKGKKVKRQPRRPKGDK